MSINWVNDMNKMHQKYGTHQAIDKLNKEQLKQFLEFRVKFLEEELNETKKAAALNSNESVDAEEVVDGLIDLCVVAIGTLDLFGIDGHRAWKEVLDANMNKEVGIKESRPNPLGLPDLIKPEGWTSPIHTGNHGNLSGL